MKNTLSKKGLVVGIIVLFIGLSVASSNANVLNVNISTIDELLLTPFIRGNTIYVDDDNTDGPWDGTLEHPYQYIRDGVDNANGGDTVYVFNGTYYERFKLTKSSINLIGEDKNTTFIDGCGKYDVIYLNINADSSHISGFSILNASYGIRGCSSYNKIYDNKIFCNTYGIGFESEYGLEEVEEICYNEIYWNIIDNNGHVSVNFFVDSPYYSIKCCYNKIYENIISNSDSGISISLCGCFNKIYRNYIHNMSWSCLSVDGNHNSIVNNDIRNGLNNGIYTWESIGNIFERNNLINIEDDAYFENSLGCRWIRNYWDDWIGFGPKIIHGIFILLPYSEGVQFVNFDFRPARKPYKITFTNNIEGCGIE